MEATPSAAAAANPAQALLDLIAHSLDEDKAEDIVVIDLVGKTSIADAMVIASGRSARQVSAIADHLVERVEASGHGHCKVEGRTHGDWVLIDAGDVIIHLFRPEVRSFYNLEKMWTDDLTAPPVAKVAL
ncbi:ribosome silencing factor [Zavarzinia sp. CC-PAN008]|uniref:ribosome silencing factor n=1 Tax=Zavarzinia sp. CC-PAN008 TaxID=3243332 RepID=UPI003F7460E1